MTKDDIIRMAREAEFSELQTNALTHKFERFAALVAEAERERCAKTKAGKPRTLPKIGLGAMHDEQNHCFAMGWREGAASVRKAIRALK